MFRAFSRPSSGAQWMQWQPLVLPSYRGDSRAVFVVGQVRYFEKLYCLHHDGRRNTENFDTWHPTVGFILPSYRKKFFRAINIYYIVRRKGVSCCSLFSGSPIPNRSSCEAVKNPLACLFLHPVIHKLYLHLNWFIVIARSWDCEVFILREIIFIIVWHLYRLSICRISIMKSLHLISISLRLMVNMCLLNS
jgi:hypothetical protein